eukprot:TRINITY_DN8325_c0_g1_i1.p1 TRINITY_DN8325_c0_g1~~TRINITY_DN8325_c0_g1_i1.p1  ORF type:complete len:144 (-),score=23.52 TRINITY_DN8325_c0_g1_i1:113-544(-)
MGYIADFIAETLPETLREFVVHICLDGACKEVFDLVEGKIHVPCTLCMSHTLDLGLEDMGDWDKPSTRVQWGWANQVMKTCVLFCAYMRARSRLVGILAERAPVKLLCPADTRFGTQFLCVNRLLRLKQDVRQLLVSLSGSRN